MLHASPEAPAAPRKWRQRWIAAGVAIGLIGAGVLVYSAAANAVVTNVTYVSDKNGGTSTVSATVLAGSSSPVTLSDAWYVCNSAITINAQVTVGASTNLILADTCDLTINSPTVLNVTSSGIKVSATRSFTIYGGVNNTGQAHINGLNGPGIGNTDAAAGIITINGGHVSATAQTAWAYYSFPGIGTSYTNTVTPGAITIQWNASVLAQGSSATNSGSPTAAGIGTGVGNGAVPNQASTVPGPITINTTGMVKANPGSPNSSFYAAPSIGRGSWSSNSYAATISVYGVSRGSETGPGAVRMLDTSGSVSDEGTFNFLAVGSSVTWVVTPNTGAKIRAVDAGLALLSGDGVGTSRYLLPVTAHTTKSASFWYSTTTTATTTPSASQDRPGNVTINGSITQDSTGTLIGSSGQAQLWINGSLAQTQNVTAGKVTFTHSSPPIGSYDYQIKYQGVTASPYLATSNSNLITGFEVLREAQAPLTLTGISSTTYTYGDAPILLAVTGGSGTGLFDLISSNPTVASLGPITNGAGTLTFNQAGNFSIAGKRAGDTSYAEATTIMSPNITVAEATPAASLIRTGGETQATPVDLTMTVDARGTGSTPQGYVQFTLNNKNLGDPLPLVDNGNGSASVSLTGIPLSKSQSELVEAIYLGQTGKYKTVTKSDFWYIGVGYCRVTPSAP